jgi:hypothetical protein
LSLSKAAKKKKTENSTKSQPPAENKKSESKIEARNE